MRELFFKAKRLDNGEWVEGDLLSFNQAELEYGIDPLTICQYTGMTDKNGKKIFESDVLKIEKKSDGMGGYYFPPLEYPTNVLVKFDLCAYMWETMCEKKYYISFPDAWCHYQCEVIGNAYDC